MKQLKSQPTDVEMLEVYSLYKQATEGDINRGEFRFNVCCCLETLFCMRLDRPGMFSLNLAEKAKWDAWNEKKGTVYM